MLTANVNNINGAFRTYFQKTGFFLPEWAYFQDQKTMLISQKTRLRGHG